ncbi:hypothetical protein WA158_000467 [Blastocystis sp. Blastoise]
MIWFIIWFCLNVLVTILNKAFFSRFKCPYPICVTLVHMICSFTCSFLLLSLKTCYRRKSVSSRRYKSIAMMSVVFASNILLGNSSLNFCSLAFVQMIRCTIPAITVIFSYLVLGQKTSFRVLCSLVPVVVGACIVYIGEIWVTPFGVFITVAGCCLSSLKTVLTKMFLSSGEKLDPVQLLEFNSMLACFEILPISVTLERKFFTEWIFNTPTLYILLLLLHGFCAFLLNISNFEATKVTNPIYITVGGNVKQVVMIFLSVYLFDSKMTTVGIIGSSITIFGATWYSLEMMKQKNPKPVANSETKI